jgi:hypothetical protein
VVRGGPGFLRFLIGVFTKLILLAGIDSEFRTVLAKMQADGKTAISPPALTTETFERGSNG